MVASKYKMFTKQFRIFIILISMQGILGLSRTRFAYFTGVECPKPYLNVIQNYNCSLVRNEEGVPLMNAGFDLTADIYNITVEYRVTGRRLGRPAETFINMKLDICDMLSAMHDHYLIKMITKEIRRVSNFPSYCPLKKGTRYQLNNYTIDTLGLPPYIPAMDWTTFSNFFVNYRKALTFANHGKIAELGKGGFKNLVLDV